MTSIAGVVPSSMPSNGNAQAWEEDCVLTRLLSERRGVSDSLIRVRPPPMPEERDPKRQKSASLEQAEDEDVNGQTTGQKSASLDQAEDEDVNEQTTTAVDWWQSGDVRRLFAPCDNLKYEINCDVKDVLIQRIELLETANHASRNWKTVVDTRSNDHGASPTFESYSETDIFSLRFRSMYLALALKQFVANVTGDMQTQWTWKQCLMYAIRAMNDVGIEFYSNFATLARWHRKLAQNRVFFLQCPRAKDFVSPLLPRQSRCHGGIQEARCCQP